MTAVPAAAMTPLLPGGPGGPDDFFTPAQSLKTAPIVAVHIWYDRPILDDPFIAVLDGPLQFIFNVTAIHSGQSGAAEEPDGGQHVVISLSGAWRWAQMERREFWAEPTRSLSPAVRTWTRPGWRPP